MSYCDWGFRFEAMKTYHDTEWSIPLHDDRKQFEFLMMETMQCGLSWDLMIKKREIFRSRRKIEAIINNARCFQKIREEYGSFDAWIWKFSGNKTILYMGHEKGAVPVSNGLSDEIAKELKKRGFKYLGTCDGVFPSAGLRNHQ